MNSKNKFLKITTILLLSSAFVGLASTSSFGSIQLDSEKTIENLNTTFEIGVINPGNQSLEITVENEEVEGLEYDYPEQNYQLEPEPLRNEPEGSGWVNINDQYAKLETIPFQVEINKSKGIREFNFTTTINARTAEGESQNRNGTHQEIIQQREYTHKLQSRSTEIEDEPDFSDELWNASEIDDRDENYTEELEPSDRNETSEETSLTNRTQRQTTEEGTSTTTIMLLISTLVAIVYLLKTLIT